MQNIGDTELTASERAWLEQVLGADELLHLVVKPRAEAESGEGLPERMMGGVWLFICLGVTVGVMEDDARAGLLLLPAWLVGILMLCRPLLRRWFRRRTLYVITDHRVLLREPGRFSVSRTAAYPLHAGMVLEVGVKPGGYGNLVFDYARDEMNGAREERVAKQVGFIDVPQVKRVQAVLESAIAACEQKNQNSH
ncbi:MAG: hypothetical protein Q4F38_09200 [Akkermansia sp.]|nr:hypothetical protein [Akkermansia sp.]